MCNRKVCIFAALKVLIVGTTRVAQRCIGHFLCPNTNTITGVQHRAYVVMAYASLYDRTFSSGELGAVIFCPHAKKNIVVMTNEKERPVQSQNEQKISLTPNLGSVNCVTMTSREIAEVAGKKHKNVLQSIRNMEPAWEKVTGLKFQPVEYLDEKGEKRPMYELTKRECLYVATKYNDEARAKLIVRWEDLECQNLKTKQLAETVSGYTEETLISVPLGGEMVQIWVKNGVIYAPASRIMRYIGMDTSISPLYRERFGESNFLQVYVTEKQPHWFVSLAGFYGMAKKWKIKDYVYNNILIMYGVREPEPIPEWTYCFTEGEMLRLISVINHRPINRQNLIDLLLNGNKK